MLREMRIQGFKSWRDTGNIRMAPITAFFGPNSSGKSSIIQFLLMLKQTVDSLDRNQVLNFGDEKTLVELGTFQDVLFSKGGVQAESLKFDMAYTFDEDRSFEESGESYEKVSAKFGVELVSNKRGAPEVEMIEHESYGYSYRLSKSDMANEWECSVSIDSTDTGNRSVMTGRNIRGPEKFYKFNAAVGDFSLTDTLFADTLSDFESCFSSIYHLGPLRDYPRRQYIWGGSAPSDMGRRGENVVAALLASQRTDQDEPATQSTGVRLDECVASWLKRLSLVEEFGVEEIAPGSNLYRAWVKRGRGSARVPLTDVGFGVSQVLPVITSCFYVPERSTMIFEQPEIHLHPAVQSGLADVFVEATSKRDIQVIVESHSEHLLQRLQRRIAEGVLSPDDVALYFCDHEDGESRISELAIDEYGNIANWPKDFFGDEFGELAAITEAQMTRKMASKA